MTPQRFSDISNAIVEVEKLSITLPPVDQRICTTFCVVLRELLAEVPITDDLIKGVPIQ